MVSTGRTDEGLTWFDRGQARVLTQDRDDFTAFVGANSVALTVRNRFAEATAEFDRVNRLLAAHGGDAPVGTSAGVLPVTLSLGVSRLLPDDEIGTLLARADKALYRAKSEGRNQVRADAAAGRLHE